MLHKGFDQNREVTNQRQNAVDNLVYALIFYILGAVVRTVYGFMAARQLRGVQMEIATLT